MEDKIKQLIEIAEKQYAEIDKMDINAHTIGYAMGVIKFIKQELETIINK
jgi:hypothetical protein